MATGIPNPLEQLSATELRARSSMKWSEYPADVLPLWVAEMDVMLAEPVARALVEAVERGDTGYPAGTAYAEALQAFARTRWDWDGLDVERTRLVPDVMMGIVEVLRLLTSYGDAVVVNCPVYPPFFSFVEHMDRRIVEAPLGADRRIDLDVLAAAFAEATAGGRSAAYLLCNPHNPVGTVHTPDELAAVAALATEHGVRVVVDEIHAPVVMPGHAFTPYLSVPGAGTGISLMSSSKGWNLAGAKAAVAVAGPEAAEDLARMPEEVSHGPSHVGIIGHTAALRKGGDWLDALISGVDHNRQVLTDLLDKHLPEVRYMQPQGTYLAWLDCSALGLGSAEEAAAGRGVGSPYVGPAAFFLEHARVALNSGPAFGSGGVGHVRLNLATSEEIITEAVRRMGQAVSDRAR